MFSNDFFKQELKQNRSLILDHANSLQNKKKEKEQDIADERENWRELDEEARWNLLSGNGMNCIEDPQPYFSAVDVPYFMHVKDADKYSYISSYISFKNILKYTTSRASYLRQNSPERRDLVIDGDNIQAYLKDGDEDGEVIMTENYKRKREHRVISNIADTLLQEQDKTIRTPKDSNTLITGPAGSGKTNALLHRVDYLISEEGLLLNNIALFCFNVGLKKYLQHSADQIVGQGSIIISFDKWREDIIRSSFLGSLPSLDYYNQESLGTDKEVMDFVNGLNKIYPKEKLRDEIKGIIRKVIPEKDSQEKLEGDFLNKWDEISKVVSLIDCVFVCGGYLLDLIKESYHEKSSEKSPERKESLLFKGLSFFLSEDKKNQNQGDKRSKEAKGFFSDITEKYYGFNYVKMQFVLPKIIELWNKFDVLGGFSIKSASSPIVRSQILYIIKDISERIPNLSKKFIEHTGIFQKYDHILIDEFQDLGAEQLMLIKSFSNIGITLAGDITQSLYMEPRHGTINFSFPIHHSFELTVTHRSTLETVHFANAILKKENTNYSKSINIVQSGDKPLIYKIESVSQIGVFMNSALKKYPTSSFLLTTYSNEECKSLYQNLQAVGLKESYIAEKNTWDFDKNIHIATYLQVKGLEFDYVVIAGLAQFLRTYKNDNKENILYTLLTRAKKRVIILYSGEQEIEHFLHSVDPTLYEIK